MMFRFAIPALSALLLGLWAWAEAPVSNSDQTLVSEEDAQAAKDDESAIEVEEVKEPDHTAFHPQKGTIPEGLLLLGRGDYYSPFAFVLDKANRTLMIWKNENGQMKLVKAYPSDMGRKPGDKQVLGDLKTPEGVYYFQEMYQGPRLNYDEYGSRAFTLDYPNFFDRKEDKTGSGIWLHGIPDSKSLSRGSRGCVVVRDDIIKKVGKYISLERTPFLIQDEIKYVKLHDYQENVKKWISWLNRWKASWESKDIDKYISFYGEGFQTMGMNREGWKQYKKNLNKRYEYIRVKVQEPTIFVHDDEAVIRFVQVYESDKLNDFGEKVLHLEKGEDGEFAIVNEEWTAISGELLAQKQKTSEEGKTITATQ